MKQRTVREAVLHLDPLQPVVKTELHYDDNIQCVKYIPCGALVDNLAQHIVTAPQHTGLLPPSCIALTAHQNKWDVTLLCDFNRCDVSYHKTGYPDFPLPRIAMRITVTNTGVIDRVRLAVLDQSAVTPDTKLFMCPFPNVNGFALCTGANSFTGYDTLYKLRGLPHRVMQIPFGDDLYSAEHSRLNLSARDLFEHLANKEPSYYYSDVLIPNGKTLKYFIEGV